jgi:uncharacterized protein (DUF1499 family)
MAIAQKPAALAPCPTSSNCVSSVAPDSNHHVEPLNYTDAPEQAWSRLQAALKMMPRLEIFESRPGYIHAVACSKLWHFKDDVEFSLDEEHHRIDVRSSSRLGTYDWGVNRKRVEAIRGLFAAAH